MRGGANRPITPGPHSQPFRGARQRCPTTIWEFLVSKSPLVPFNSTICPRNGPKRRQKAPKSAQCALAPRNQARAVSWAMWLQTKFRGHLVHPQPLTFCGFQASELSNEPPRPRTSGHLVQPEGSPARARLGPAVGPSGSPGRKKRFFFKVVPRLLGMLKQVFLGRFEPVVTRFGPWKIPKCHEIGMFQDQKWVKKGPKSPRIRAMCTSTPKPSTGRILGYVAPNQILRTHGPPAMPIFLWFPSLRIAQRAT